MLYPMKICQSLARTSITQIIESNQSSLNHRVRVLSSHTVKKTQNGEHKIHQVQRETLICNNEPSTTPPKWSFHKRTLPKNLKALSSSEGKKLFLESLQNGHAESYFPLSEQFVTQGEPAFCGLSTLVMILNALSIDPNVRWKSGWRWFDEQLLMNGCCIDMKVIMDVGITMEQFKMIGRCNGVFMDNFHPFSEGCSAELRKNSINLFRSHVIKSVSSTSSFLVSSYARSALGQVSCKNYLIVNSFPLHFTVYKKLNIIKFDFFPKTGDGHFSPIAAYHKTNDEVLILDVARFKYSPHWVKLAELYDAMTKIDQTTNLSRGWFLIHSPNSRKECSGLPEDGRRPGESVNFGKEKCPVGDIKIEYCSAKTRK